MMPAGPTGKVRAKGVAAAVHSRRPPPSAQANDGESGPAESPTLVLRGGRVARSGSARPERLEIAIGADGRIASLAAALPAAPGVREIDLGGRLIVPGLVDVHQHLDKTRTLRRVVNPEGTLDGAMAAFRDYAAGMSGEDVAARAERTLEACLARGTVAIRSHANVDPETRIRGVEALVGLAETWKDRITVQVVAFLTGGALRAGVDARGWLEDAIGAGAGIVGGAPALADEPGEFLDLLFDAADRHGLPLDLHLDEHLDPERHLFDAVSERTRALGFQGRVVAGHCSALSALTTVEARRVIAGLAEAGIGVVTLPAANLFLQGRGREALPPRGLTRVAALVAAGVPVAAASDNIQDPFIPTGTGDMLEIARWTLLAGHLGATDMAGAFDMVTGIPAQLMGLGRSYGIEEGARADLLIAEAEDAEDLMASGPLERTVVVGGRLVIDRL